MLKNKERYHYFFHFDVETHDELFVIYDTKTQKSIILTYLSSHYKRINPEANSKELYRIEDVVEFIQDLGIPLIAGVHWSERERNKFIIFYFDSVYREAPAPSHELRVWSRFDQVVCATFKRVSMDCPIYENENRVLVDSLDDLMMVYLGTPGFEIGVVTLDDGRYVYRYIPL